MVLDRENHVGGMNTLNAHELTFLQLFATLINNYIVPNIVTAGRRSSQFYSGTVGIKIPNFGKVC